jgi:hypothetical protein
MLTWVTPCRQPIKRSSVYLVPSLCQLTPDGIKISSHSHTSFFLDFSLRICRSRDFQCSEQFYLRLLLWRSTSHQTVLSCLWRNSFISISTSFVTVVASWFLWSVCMLISCQYVSWRVMRRVWRYPTTSIRFMRAAWTVEHRFKGREFATWTCLDWWVFQTFMANDCKLGECVRYSSCNYSPEWSSRTRTMIRNITVAQFRIPHVWG